MIQLLTKPNICIMLYKIMLVTGGDGRKMKSININQLQAQISAVMKDIERGETYEVMRYSRPIAVIKPKKEADRLTDNSRCNECLAKMDKILEKFEV